MESNYSPEIPDWGTDIGSVRRPFGLCLKRFGRKRSTCRLKQKGESNRLEALAVFLLQA